MDIEFLVHMIQFNKCGSVRNDEIFKLHFGVQALESASPASCKTPANRFHLPKQLIEKKQRTQE